jgi:hypothetical protein
MYWLSLPPNSTNIQTNSSSNSTQPTLKLVADYESLKATVDAISSNCSAYVNTTYLSSADPTAFSITDSNVPKPEQVVQYYRASTAALTLDGYNNTGALVSLSQWMANSSDWDADNAGMQSVMEDAPLPDNLNQTLLGCVNVTIGESIPLVDPDSGALSLAPCQSLLTGVLAIYMLLHSFVL